MIKIVETKKQRQQWNNEYYEKNKEKILEYRKDYWTKKKLTITEEERQKHRIASKKWRETNYIKYKYKFVAAAKKRILLNKQILVDYKGGKCEICGYKKCLGALHFHHRNTKTKEYTISAKLACSIKILKKEVDKCDLICSNCHAELHWEEQKNG